MKLFAFIASMWCLAVICGLISGTIVAWIGLFVSLMVSWGVFDESFCILIGYLISFFLF